MSTSNGPSRKSTSGLGLTRKGLEQFVAHPKVFEEYVAPQDPKYINYKAKSGLQVVSQLPADLITTCFATVDAERAERRLRQSLPLDSQENENVEDNEQIRVAMAERLWKFDGLEDAEVHSPPFVTEGNVAVPSLDGGKITSELEKHEASISK